MVYSDRSELDLTDETIRIKNFLFSRKLWWKNCYKTISFEIGNNFPQQIKDGSPPSSKPKKDMLIKHNSFLEENPAFKVTRWNRALKLCWIDILSLTNMTSYISVKDSVTSLSKYQWGNVSFWCSNTMKKTSRHGDRISPYYLFL